MNVNVRAKNKESEPQRIGEILPNVMANIEKRMLENRTGIASEDVPGNEPGAARDKD